MKIFFLPVFLLILNFSAFAEEQSGVVKQAAFVRKLFDEKKYFDCINESRRLLSFKNDKRSSDEIEFIIAASYYLGGQYNFVIDNYSSSCSGSFRYALLGSSSFYELNNHRESLGILSHFSYEDMDDFSRNRLFTQRIKSHLMMRDFKSARGELDTFSGFSANMPFVNSMYASIARGENLESKSGGIAMLLSAIVPGAGQLYCNRISDALISLAGVAGTGAGSIYFYSIGYHPVAYAFAFLTLLFYSGNIYGAHNSASEYNRDAQNRYINEVISGMKRYSPERDIEFSRMSGR